MAVQYLGYNLATILVESTIKLAVIDQYAGQTVT